MQNIFNEISQASECDIREILDAVLYRYCELFPEWELSLISLKKAENRDQQLADIIRMLQSMFSNACPPN